MGADTSGVLTFAKRIVIGRPLASSEQEHQRLAKKIALATFSSDAISSTAYATEEILFVTAVGGSSLALGLDKLVPIAIVVAVLLAIVSFSYRQTIFAYPSGGGSYIVSRENLGEMPSLIAGGSLLVDYILTVAVSVSSGVAAIISIPTFRGLVHERVPLCLVLVLLISLANLRGVKESGKIFAVPTYVYIASLSTLLAIGLWRSFFGHLAPVPFDPEAAAVARQVGGSLTLFVLLKGFSSGAVALTGVEAISNGVPAFEKPEAKNAATTMTWMAIILGTLFFGVQVLAHHLHPYPSEHETVISQMARAVVGSGPFYWILQFATAAILTLAANTAYADFPRLSSIIATDGYLPRQFANRGDRLVFSNGVIILGFAASGLLILFGGKTNALIPLYAIGVFTSFTLSQLGMVRHHLHEKADGWQFGAVVNGIGSVATAIVTIIVATTKFKGGAWVPIVVVPLIVLLFKTIRRHYDTIGAALVIEPGDVPAPPTRHAFVVLVSRVHTGVVEALQYATSLRPDHISALHIAEEPADHLRVLHDWERFGFDVPLDIVDSPYRELVEPVERYLDQLEKRSGSDRITVVIPEFVVGVRSASNLLHGQQALSLKLALLGRPRTAVLSVPFHVGMSPAAKVAVAVGTSGSSSTRAATVPAVGGELRRTRLTASTEELHRAHLVTRFAQREDGSTRIGEIPLRRPVRVAGEVTASRVVPRAGSPWLELTLDDGTGSMKLIFTGRRKIAGIQSGRALTVEGVAREEHDGKVMLNPVYTLLS